MQLVALLVVFVAMAGVLLLMFGGFRPTASRGGQGYDLVEGATIGWLTPFMMMLAAASILEVSGSDSSGSAGIGAGFGLLAFLCTRGGGGVPFVVDVAGSVLGVVATAAVVGAYVSGQTCGPSSPAIRVVQLGLMGTLCVFAWLHAVFANPTQAAKGGLALFSAVEGLVFLASPLGTELVGLGQVLSIVGALALGAVAGFAPAVAMTVVAAAVSLTAIGGAAAVGDACSLPGATTGSVTLAVFAVSWLALSALFAAVGRDRT